MTYSKLCFPYIRVWALAANVCFLLKFNRTVHVRWLPSVADCNRNWGEGPCPQATSTAVFLLANARKHKLEICQGWAGQGTSLLPKIARAKVVPGTLSTPRPPPQGPCVTPAVTSMPAFLPTGQGLGSHATLGCQQARQQWVLGNVFQALFLQVFPLSPENVLNWEGSALLLNKHLW